jgi:Circularly permutated YpsA SLOG family
MLTVISGGQTGVDRAALDAAIAARVTYRGWCPKGGWAEDCPDAPGVRAHYPGLRETPEAAPEQRTDWNVRDADSLLVLVDSRGIGASKGTARAVAQAKALGKPHRVIDVDGPEARSEAAAFLRAQPGEGVCIAGPRESEAPGIYGKALQLLSCLLREQA